MVTRRRFLALPVVCAALVLSGVLSLSAQSGEQIDLAAIQRIKEEGFDRSKVMDTAWWLTDMYGPRLTNSPQMRAAADWAVKKMNEWGLANVKQEPWGAPFGRGWSNQRTVLHVVKPEPWPVIAYARAWTPGTNGPATAEAILAPMTTEADFDKFKGKLAGKIVLIQNRREVELLWDAQATRFTDKQLDDMAMQEMPRQGGGPGGPGGPGNFQAIRAFQTKRTAFLVAEGALAVLEPGSGMGDSGSVLVAAARATRRTSSRADATRRLDRALQPHRAAAGAQRPRHPRHRRPQHVPGRRPLDVTTSVVRPPSYNHQVRILVIGQHLIASV